MSIKVPFLIDWILKPAQAEVLPYRLDKLACYQSNPSPSKLISLCSSIVACSSTQRRSKKGEER